MSDALPMEHESVKPAHPDTELLQMVRFALDEVKSKDISANDFCMFCGGLLHDTPPKKPVGWDEMKAITKAIRAE